MLIQVLVDNRKSWIVSYAEDLVAQLSADGHDARLLHAQADVVKGDILCLLSCEKIFKQLDLNKNNLVVHESDLPKGKGWSPVSWQILEGKNEIPVTLFEASKDVDAGPIYAKRYIRLEGHELLPEIRHQQGVITIELIREFVNKYPNNISSPQEGESTFYPRRGVESSELNIDKSIVEQFNLLRICDNERYPAFFIKDGRKYVLKIEKQ